MKRTHNNNKRTRRFQALIIALFLVVSISPQCVFGGESSSSSDTTVTPVSSIEEEQSQSDTETASATEDTESTAVETTEDTEIGNSDGQITTEPEITTTETESEETSTAGSDIKQAQSTDTATISIQDAVQEETSTDESAETVSEDADTITSHDDIVAAATVESESETPTLTAVKTLTDNGDGTYNINLSVKGTTSSSEESNHFNVVIIADRSGSMGKTTDAEGNSLSSTDSSMNRAEVQMDAIKELGKTLDALNTDASDPTVAIGLVSFGTKVADNNGGYSLDDYYTDFDNGDTETTFEKAVDGLTAYSEKVEMGDNTSMGATNWEAALEKAYNFSFTQQSSSENPVTTEDRSSYPTYYIFISDGQPTVRNTRNAFVDGLGTYDGNYKTTIYKEYDDSVDIVAKPSFCNGDYRFASNPSMQVYGNGIGESFNTTTETYDLNYRAALHWAQLIANKSGGNLFTVSVFEDEDDLEAYYYTGMYAGVLTRTDEVQGMEKLTTDAGENSDHYYDADNAEALAQSLKAIASTITSNSYVTDVVVTDTLTEMTSADIRDGIADGEVTYTKSTTSSDGTTTTTEWTDAPTISIDTETGEVTWDLGDMELENGVTYTASFRVWPNQDAYDLVAKLNNGTISYDSLTDDQKSQIHENTTDDPDFAGNTTGYSLKTNKDGTQATYDTVTVTNGTPGEPTAADPVAIENPDPVPLEDVEMTIQKEWKDSDGNALSESDLSNIESITLKVQADGEDFFIDSSGNTQTVTLTASGEWAATIHISPGLIDKNDVNLDTGHDFKLVETSVTVKYKDGTTATMTDAGFTLSSETVHPMLDKYETVSVKYGGDSNSTFLATNTKNAPTTIDVPMKKIDSTTTINGISGAVFSLYKATVGTDGEWSINGDAIQTGITSGTDGTFTIEGLEAGNYLLEETSTPAGYQEPTHEWRITVSEGNDGLTATVQAYEDGQWTTVDTDTDGNNLIENVPVDYNLPSTGGLGSLPFAAAGSAIVAFAAALYIFIKKSKKEGS